MAESYDKEQQLATLHKGATVWNPWRREHPEIKINLSEADLHSSDLSEADLHSADLRRANLNNADLRGAELQGADLQGAYVRKANLDGANLESALLSSADLERAHLIGANLNDADLRGANLNDADLRGAYLIGANLSKANLTIAKLTGADLRRALLRGAILYQASLSRADLMGADLMGADLMGADLTAATCIQTDFTGATLTGCRVYGMSCWNVKLNSTMQQDLCITSEYEPGVTVDNLNVAQFIYLMLNNAEIREVIDTITSKIVLILGRFTTERKVVLDALRDELRKHNYLPVVFDFEKPNGRTYTETVTLLARMARFIIADLTSPSSLPQELEAIVPTVIVPVRPIIELGHAPRAKYKDYRPYPWVLPVHQYNSQDQLLASIQGTVIAPAEAKAEELRRRR
jgi:uncharacterized protein YjbI with pentapeptide repeats